MIPGTLPEPRRRRLAPVPCNTRLLALISICIIFSKMWITRDQMIRLLKLVILTQAVKKKCSKVRFSTP
jgi:hypothetical protein